MARSFKELVMNDLINSTVQELIANQQYDGYEPLTTIAQWAVEDA